MSIEECILKLYKLSQISIRTIMHLAYNTFNVSGTPFMFKSSFSGRNEKFYLWCGLHSDIVLYVCAFILVYN